MKSLTGGSALKLSLVKYNDKHIKSSCFWCSTTINTSATLKDASMGCAYKHFKVNFSFSKASQREMIRTVFSAPASSSSSSSSSSDTQVEDEDMETPDESDKSKTVHLKFKLQRECLFGQHFFIVGEDPIFGLWDPSQAIPLNWSEGHVWTVELDVPIGKLIKYKFILKGGGGDTVLWQPGEDRVLQTWETMKTITVVDDWDNSEVQRVTEGELIAEPSDEHAIDTELLMVAENLSQSSGNLEEKEELNNAGIKSSLENVMAKVSEVTSEQKGEVEVSSVKADTETNQNKLGSSGSTPIRESLLAPEMKTNLVSDEEFPVLVPGLMQNEEPSVAAVFDNEVTDTSLAEELNVSGLKFKEEPPVERLDSRGTTELMFNGHQRELHEEEDQQKLEKPLLSEQEDQLEMPVLAEREERLVTQPPVTNNVVNGDMKWGQRTLQKFLMSFGLLRVEG